MDSFPPFVLVGAYACAYTNDLNVLMVLCRLIRDRRLDRIMYSRYNVSDVDHIGNVFLYNNMNTYESICIVE